MACGLSPNFVGRRGKAKNVTNVTSNVCRDSSHVRISCTIFVILVVQDVTPCVLAYGYYLLQGHRTCAFLPCKRRLFVIQRSANYKVESNFKICRYTGVLISP